MRTSNHEKRAGSAQSTVLALSWYARMTLEPGLSRQGYAGWLVALGPRESTPSLEGGPNDSSDHFFVVEEPFQIADTKKANAPAEGTLLFRRF